MMGGRDLTPEQLRVSLVGEGTVRLSIGLEDPDDLTYAVEKLGTANANANPIIHPMFNLRIESPPPSSTSCKLGRGQSLSSRPFP